MWSAEYSTEIDATPDVINAFFADTARWPEWNAGTEELAVGRLDGPDRVACELLTFARHAQLAGP